MKSGIKFWQLLLGLIPSVASIISVVQRVFAVGLVPVLADALAFYRDLVSPLFYWIPFSVPHWYKDLVVISTVALASFFRAYIFANVDRNAFSSDLATWQRWKGLLYVLWVIFCGTFLLGGLLLIVMIPMALTAKNNDEPHHAGMRNTAILFAMSFIAAAIFFATNAVFRP